MSNRFGNIENNATPRFNVMQNLVTFRKGREETPRNSKRGGMEGSKAKKKVPKLDLRAETNRLSGARKARPRSSNQDNRSLKHKRGPMLKNHKKNFFCYIKEAKKRERKIKAKEYKQRNWESKEIERQREKIEQLERRERDNLQQYLGAKFREKRQGSKFKGYFYDKKAKHVLENRVRNKAKSYRANNGFFTRTKKKQTKRRMESSLNRVIKDFNYRENFNIIDHLRIPKSRVECQQNFQIRK